MENNFFKSDNELLIEEILINEIYENERLEQSLKDFLFIDKITQKGKENYNDEL